MHVQAMVQDDILCLVFDHPLMHYFLYEPRSTTYASSSSTSNSGTTSFSAPEVLRNSPGGRSVFSVRYRCLCEIIASGSTEGTYVAPQMISRWKGKEKKRKEKKRKEKKRKEEKRKEEKRRNKEGRKK